MDILDKLLNNKIFCQDTFEAFYKGGYNPKWVNKMDKLWRKEIKYYFEYNVEENSFKFKDKYIKRNPKLDKKISTDVIIYIRECYLEGIIGVDVLVEHLNKH